VAKSSLFPDSEHLEVERFARCVGEDKAVIRPRRPRPEFHFELTPPLRFQSGHNVQRQRDRAKALPCLRRLFVPLARLPPFQAPPDRDALLFLFIVRPLQTQVFARPRTEIDFAVLSCYTSLNSQRYTLMAEDAVESAGAKAPAITISTQQFIAGEGGLMSDNRCPAEHPTLGVQRERRRKDCATQGVEHTSTLPDGRGEFCPNPHGSTPMHKYFRAWMKDKNILSEDLEKKF
jgi:hypothetical protein